MSDISTYYGGTVLAMKGEDSIAMFTDLRYGQSSITTLVNNTKIHAISKRIFLGLPEFLPDAQSLLSLARMNHNLFVLEEEREMEPEEFSSMLSSILYSKRSGYLYVSPIVGGICSDGKPYITSLDCLGCKDDSKDFVVSGTASKSLIGVCENLWRPSLSSEELFTVGAQAILNGLDRDALSGWGIKGYLITKDKIVSRLLKSSQD